jgi:hypothetical protein
MFNGSFPIITTFDKKIIMKLRNPLIIAVIVLSALEACNSDRFNKEIMSGTPDSLYNPSGKSNIDSAASTRMIAPVVEDSTGAQSGRMSDTKKDTTKMHNNSN